MKRYGHFEEILKDVGSWGCYQWFVYGLMQYSNLLQAYNQNFMAFGKIEPAWKCGQSIKDENGTVSIAFDENAAAKPMTCPNFTVCQQVPDEELHFYSQVRDWGLYCDLSYVPMFIVSIQMFGIMPGAVIFNHLTDNYGRKWSTHLLNVGVLALGLGSAFVESWQVFAAIRFLIGVLFGGLFMVTVVTQIEIVEESDRMSFYALDCWSVSNAILALVAYLTHTWRRLIIVSNCMCIPLLILLFWVKESPRWLLQKERYEEAADALNHIAKWNGKEVRIDTKTLVDMIHFRRRLSSTGSRQEIEKNKKKNFTLLDIFHSKESTIHFLSLSYAWLAIGCISYGLVYQNTAYTGSPFINYAVAAAMRVMTQIIVFVADRYGKVRRRVLYLINLGLVVVMLCSMTIAVMVADPVNNHAAATALRVIGVLASGSMSALWLIVYLLAIEVFPTVIRNIAMGGCSVMARIGSVVGPQLLYLQTFWIPIPFIAFTIVSMFNFISAFFTLPETSGLSLPDALDDKPTKADDPAEHRILEAEEADAHCQTMLKNGRE